MTTPDPELSPALKHLAKNIGQTQLLTPRYALFLSMGVFALLFAFYATFHQTQITLHQNITSEFFVQKWLFFAILWGNSLWIMVHLSYPQNTFKPIHWLPTGGAILGLIYHIASHGLSIPPLPMAYHFAGHCTPSVLAGNTIMACVMYKYWYKKSAPTAPHAMGWATGVNITAGTLTVFVLFCDVYYIVPTAILSIVLTITIYALRNLYTKW